MTVLGRGPLPWLEAHRSGAGPDEALAFFDALPAVPVEGMTGRWRGRELPTGSPLDGLLTAYGWWGKEVLDAETVHPLLFQGRSGPYPVNPAMVPLSVLRTRPRLARSALVRRIATTARPLARTRRPAARLRTVTVRGVPSAAMVYDALPIVDAFRRVADDVALGLMDMRGLDAVFLFVLHLESRTADPPTGRVVRN